MKESDFSMQFFLILQTEHSAIHIDLQIIKSRLSLDSNDEVPFCQAKSKK